MNTHPARLCDLTLLQASGPGRRFSPTVANQGRVVLSQEHCLAKRLRLPSRAMLTHSSIVVPVIALALWTHVMWAWMYATRIPAILKLRMVLDSSAPRGEQMATLPAPVRWKADNYNHLMEQPTVFYAVALGLAVLGEGNGMNATLAWAYFASRVVHSLIQATFNNITVRFSVFAISSLILIALTINAARIVF
jgi:hypothetical protein